jgi:glycosyltransferase involved in cell wall biosynthesis
VVKIVFISRVKPEKGIETLFKSLDLIQDLDFRLDIYGILLDDYRGRFTELICRRDYAEYRGVLASSEVVSHMLSYDLMVFPTTYGGEGFPGVLVDAAIAGLPVIATDFAYNSEIVRDGFNGLLVSPADTEDLASKIELLIQDRNLRHQLGRNNRLISREYTVDKVIGDTLLKELEKLGWWEDDL